MLGLVGAGGIGLVLQGAIDTFNWQEAATILFAILALVIIGEFVSAWLRRQMIRGIKTLLATKGTADRHRVI